MIGALEEKFDYVFCDSPAGIERGAQLAMRYADEAVIVTNPEVSSVRDSDRIIGLLDSRTLKAEHGETVNKHVLVTRYDAARAARGEMLSINDVLEILSTPLLGIIPESQGVLRASNVGSPVTLSEPINAAAQRLYGRGQAAGRRRPAGRASLPEAGLARPAVRKEGGMTLFDIFKRRGSAPVARERLQVLLAYERKNRNQPDLVAILREEIMAVIARHVQVGQDDVQIAMDRGRHDVDAGDRRPNSEWRPDRRLKHVSRKRTPVSGQRHAGTQENIPYGRGQAAGRKARRLYILRSDPPQHCVPHAFGLAHPKAAPA